MRSSSKVITLIFLWNININAMAINYTQPSWFFDAVGREEKQIKNGDFKKEADSWILSVGKNNLPVGQFIYPSFSSLKAEFSELAHTPYKLGRLKFKINYGRDILKVAQSKEVEGAYIQVASQFNALESPSARKVAITDYYTDYTQGPRAVMTTAASALFRYRMHPNFNALSNTELGKYVVNGYLLWGSSPPKPQTQDDYLLDEIYIPMMLNARPESWTSGTVNHVFSASAPTNAYGNSGDNVTQRKICYEILLRQYLGIGYQASIHSQQTGKRTRVYLTKVGAGTFQNDPEILLEVIADFFKIFQEEPLDVFFENYHPSLEIDQKIQAIFNLKS